MPRETISKARTAESVTRRQASSMKVCDGLTYDMVEAMWRWPRSYWTAIRSMPQIVDDEGGRPDTRPVVP
ncbi:hypothetical protein [Streptomyces sp. NPDC056661]|uniref:hypothetical protein n=1 Tax=unclassified Streptomyces TaxID=2593676 RepID=UPI00362788FD